MQPDPRGRRMDGGLGRRAGLALDCLCHRHPFHHHCSECITHHKFLLSITEEYYFNLNLAISSQMQDLCLCK